MPGEFYAADLHINHLKVANIRGFATPEEWNKALLANWNAVVRPDDRVWLPGDITVGRMELAWGWLDALHGEKHLITGNHDQVFPGHRDSYQHQREWLAHFASVQPFTRRRLEGQDVMCSHFPYSGDHPTTERYTQYRLADEGLSLIHGHTHSTEKVSRSVNGTLQICVSLDAWGLKPAPLAEIMRIIRDASSAAKANGSTTHPLMLEGGIPR
jgi:calcineurin-like phosphoesterase family protein